jgi:hypothetical protein
MRINFAGKCIRRCIEEEPENSKNEKRSFDLNAMTSGTHNSCSSTVLFML